MIGRLLKFLGIFSAVYIALLLLFSFTGLEKGYFSFLKNSFSSIYGNFKSEGGVDFQLISEDGHSHQKLKTTIYNVEEKKTVTKRIRKNPSLAKTLSYFGSWANIHLWVFAAVPFIFLLTLIISSPIRLPKKLIALAIGSILFHLFIFLKMWLYLLKEFNNNEVLNVVNLSSGVGNFVNFIYALIENMGFGLFLCLIIWVLVSFTNKDIKSFSEVLKSN